MMSAMAERTRRYDAAGGILIDEDGRVALLERVVTREGKQVRELRLPKGHLEPGETDEQAALREVWEETGLAPSEILFDLGTAAVEFVHAGVQVLRRERWYLMRSPQPLTHGLPDAEPPFRLFIAGDLAAAARLLTFSNEQDVALRARAWA
jgi:8-oxo-dGTP pyrophosphatase MutT (NUDIX family)